MAGKGRERPLGKRKIKVGEKKVTKLVREGKVLLLLLVEIKPVFVPSTASYFDVRRK